MSEETKKALEAFVLQVIDAARTGAQWTSDQAPLLVQEWLTWQAADSIIWIVLGLILLGISFAFFRKIKAAVAGTSDDGCQWFMLLPGSVGFVFAVANTLDLVKVLVAPRLVVFEKFVELIK